jgi:tripartite ATP-independent transporter DctP family solute receptor
MLKTLLAGVAGAALLTGFAASAQAQVQNRNIRVSNGVNQDHPNGKGVEVMAKCATDKSEGKIKITGFWGGALGGDLQATQALRSGTQEMVVTSSSPLVGILPEIGVFDLPFLISSEKEADALLDGEFGKYISDKMPGVGLVNLAYWENGFRNATNSKQPIKKWEDFQGVKMRVMQNPVFLDTFKNMGANAVPMNFGEVFAALETRTIDGQEKPLRHHRDLEDERGPEIPVGDAPRLHALHGADLEAHFSTATRPRSRRFSRTAPSRPATCSGRPTASSTRNPSSA